MAEEYIEPDTVIDDEAYGSGQESDTTTIASEVLDYQYENGRRYHAYKSGKYILPNDETEQDRLDIVHHLLSIVLGGRNYLAPLNNPQRILDLGTGTGIWALDMAEEFPSAQVIGTDLSPIQPTWMFPNALFMVDDAEGDWGFAENSFDYIHIRTLGGSIQNWPRLLKRVFDHLRPGGYVEMAECPAFYPFCDDDTYSTDSSLWRYFDLVNKASAKRGISMGVEIPLSELISEFEIVVDEPFKVPFGMWPMNKKQKIMGKWMQLVCQSGFEAYGLALLSRELNMSKEEGTALMESCKNELDSKKIHIYMTYQHVVGMKPLSSSGF